MKHIASVSWGKDSLYMLWELISRCYPLDEVVFFDTGMEYQAVYEMRDRMLPVLAEKGIIYTELFPKQDFLYLMLKKPVNGKNGFHLGYAWCGGPCRWGTTEKIKAIDKYTEERNAVVYVGIAADETKRLKRTHKSYKRFPMADWGIAECAALSKCYDLGFDWKERGVRLYDILCHVNCWCCANKNLTELKNIYNYLPFYWQKLKELQAQTDRPMKGFGKSVFELERRFSEQYSKEGISRNLLPDIKILLKGKRFYGITK